MITFLLGVGVGLVAGSWFWLEDIVGLYEAVPHDGPDTRRVMTRWTLRLALLIALARGRVQEAERMFRYLHKEVT